MRYQCKTRQEIADEYGIHRNTLYRWMKYAGLDLPSRLLAPADQIVIYNYFGYPSGRIRAQVRKWLREK